MKKLLTSRGGHLTSLVGALIVAFGGLVPPWQRFELAGVSARGIEVPLVAQIVLILAGLVVIAAVLGWVTGLRRTAVVTASGSVFLTGWVAAAHVGRAAGLPLMPLETIVMGSGWYVALVGAVVATTGSVYALLGDRP
ncbi:MAG: hypothetical protein EP329_01660 [Deltaproteobacteria bacterium]|nr:MAG: hypothetical protein EP329_01660 [Deltaproteobacteria bacterium]